MEPSGGTEVRHVTRREEANSMSVGAAWLWCLAGCLGSWYAVARLALELLA